MELFHIFSAQQVGILRHNVQSVMDGQPLQKSVSHMRKIHCILAAVIYSLYVTLILNTLFIIWFIPNIGDINDSYLILTKQQIIF